MSSTASVLEQAAHLIKSSGRVVKGQLALNRKGKPVAPHVGSAVAWDAQGALYHVRKVKLEKTAEDRFLPAALAHLDHAALGLYRKGIVRVNDELGLDAVLTVYRAAWKAASSS